MYEAICFVLVLLLVACWRALMEKGAAYEKEWRAHIETHKENGRLQVEIERLRIKYGDWD